MRLSLTSYILAGMLLGAVVGALCHGLIPSQALRAEVAADFSIATDIFLRLIKMIIAPLVFSTLVTGIVKMGDMQAVARVGIKVLGWFLAASLVSLLIGLVMVDLFQPGAGLNLTEARAGHGAALGTTALSLKEFLPHLVPTSIFAAMAQNELVQILVFAGFFSAAALALGERSRAIVALLDDVGHIMMKATAYVMRFAPIAVFAALASVLTLHGVGILVTYGKLVGEYYLALLLFWSLLSLAASAVLGRRLVPLLRQLREPVLIGFSTASSEAAYPVLLERLERFGVPPKLASFLLPLGYSFNLDGSMVYCTFATLFVAQAYGIHLAIPQQIAMFLIFIISSKGIAGVARAALVVVAATLPQFNIPDAGMMLLIAADQFMDMGRTATNLFGNGIATAVVASWEEAKPG